MKVVREPTAYGMSGTPYKQQAVKQCTAMQAAPKEKMAAPLSHMSGTLKLGTLGRYVRAEYLL